MQENIICIKYGRPSSWKGTILRPTYYMCSSAIFSCIEGSIDCRRKRLRRRSGIQSDLKTFSAFGIFGCSVVTAITSQNTFELRDVFPIPPKIISNQLKSILSDFKLSRSKNWNAI